MSAPTNLAGHMDAASLSAEAYGNVVDLLLEQTPELRPPFSVRTFARMRHEPQLAAILRVYLLALERGTWMIDPAGCSDEVAARIADDFGLPIKGDENPTPTGARRRRFAWGKHLPTAAGLSLTYGHAPFAQSWVPGPDGKWRLGMVQERMPQTITDLGFNGDGTLAWAEQSNDIATPIRITTADHRLVWYVREREGSNYFGNSIFRASYGPWLIKDQMLRVHATSIRRNGMGVWQARALPGTSPQPNEMAAAQRTASQIQASERQGVAWPPGFTGELTGMSGSLPDTLAFITYLDRQMTRSTLTSILDMATAERGARSLGETVMQMMIYAQQAEADRIALDATEQLVIPLVDANFGEDEPAPQIVVDDIGADDQLTAQDMNWLLQYGGLTPDDVLEAHTRQRYGLPDIDTATRRTDATVPAPDPNAPTTDPEGGTDA